MSDKLATRKLAPVHAGSRKLTKIGVDSIPAASTISLGFLSILVSS